MANWKTTYDANERLPNSWHVNIISTSDDPELSISFAQDFDHEPSQEEVEKASGEMQAEEEAKYQAWRESGAKEKYEDWSPAPPVEVLPDKERVFVAVDSKGKESGEFRTKEEAVAAAMTAVSAEVKP
jgi:hypothetical protein